MASEQTINQISKALGEVDEGPLAQISAVIEELGEETALELLAETEKIEKSGGLMRGDGSGRRSPGGVYFFLARQKLPREVRARIFNDKMPRAPKAPGSETPPPPASSRAAGGGPPPSSPGAPRRRVFEVVPASKPPHSQGRFERNFERGYDRDRHDRDRDRGFDRDRGYDRHEPRSHAPESRGPDSRGPDSRGADSRAGYEPRAPWPPKPTPGAYVPPELPSAVGRAKAKQAITTALAGVNPSDQYLVLLDLLADLHAQHGGEVPKSEATPASAAPTPASTPPASAAPASQPPASQPATSRSASSEPPPSSDRPAAKTARSVKPRATTKTATAKTRTRGA